MKWGHQPPASVIFLKCGLNTLQQDVCVCVKKCIFLDPPLDTMNQNPGCAVHESINTL